MHIVVVEDEEVAAGRLLRLARRILGEDLVSSIHVPSLEEARTYFNRDNRGPIDLLFLDLNLHGRDGFRLLSECTAEPFQTIIVSAQHDQALRAFEYGVTDFVPKPYDEERLRLAIRRARYGARAATGRLKVLNVKVKNEIVPVRLETLLFIKGADDYSELHCNDGITHLHRKSLSVLARLLPDHFDRVHRSYIVNTRVVEAYGSEPGSRYFVRLTTGTRLPVSRGRFKELRQRSG